jgi:hypothetical protein
MTIKYLRRTTSGAAGNGLEATIKYPRGITGIGLSMTIKYLRRTARSAACSGLGTTINYLRRRDHRPWHHDRVPATHS